MSDEARIDYIRPDVHGMVTPLITELPRGGISGSVACGCAVMTSQAGPGFSTKEFARRLTFCSVVGLNVRELDGHPVRCGRTKILFVSVV